MQNTSECKHNPVQLIIEKLKEELTKAQDTYIDNKELLSESTIISPDDGDTSSQLEQRALAEAAMKRASIKTRRITKALARAESGTITECVDCEGEIPTKRILFTMSTRCIHCQEIVDAQQRHFA